MVSIISTEMLQDNDLKYGKKWAALRARWRCEFGRRRARWALAALGLANARQGRARQRYLIYKQIEKKYKPGRGLVKFYVLFLRVCRRAGIKE